MTDDFRPGAQRPVAGGTPALERLDVGGRRRWIPFVQQMEASDCAAACLSMVLGFHGHHAPLEEVRRATGSGRAGVSAGAILHAAGLYRLRGRGVRLEPEELKYLPKGAILHWAFNHYVVFESVTRRGVNLVDPAAGRRWIPHDTFRKQFTGIALILEPEESFTTRSRDKGSLRAYLGRLRTHTGVLVRVVVISLMVQLFALALPLLTGVLVDEIVPHGDVDLLKVLGLGMLAIVTFQFLASLIRSYMLIYLRTMLDAQLSLGFMYHLVSLPYAFFLERPTGDLLVRYQSNQRVREILTSSALSTLFDGSLVALYLIVLFAISPTIAALSLGLGALQVCIFLFTRKRFRDLGSMALEVRSRSHSDLTEMVAGIETLKALGAEGRWVERWSHRFVDELNVALAQGRLMAWTGALRSALSLGSPLLILIAGGFLVIQGDLRLGTMLALNALAVGFLGPLGNLVSTGLDMQEVRGHLDRLEDVRKMPPEQDERQVSPVDSVTGRVTLERVGFRYGEHQPPVLQDISQEIEPGQKVAIVGRSGAGKTTLARLVAGLYKPTAGRILFDGKDLAMLDLRSLRVRVGVVTQDAHVFGTTIRNNISLGDASVSAEDVADACRQAQIHDDILAMPLGYDTLLTDRGASLSGGQRQRIALARVLVRKPRLLLLDEATSDLDAVTEGLIMATLGTLQCTRIIIAHRLSTIADSDLILMMQGGRVVEAGNHRQLLASGGPYAELVAAQTEVP